MAHSFKVGDKVRIVKDDPYAPIGTVCTIDYIDYKGYLWSNDLPKHPNVEAKWRDYKSLCIATVSTSNIELVTPIEELMEQYGLRVDGDDLVGMDGRWCLDWVDVKRYHKTIRSLEEDILARVWYLQRWRKELDGT